MIRSGSIPSSVHSTLERSAERFANRVCIAFENHVYSFTQIDDLSSRFANVLIKEGIDDGDRIACFLPSSPQFAVTYYGALKTGAVVTPIDHRYRQNEVRFQIIDSGAKYLVTLDELWEKLGSSIADVGLSKVFLTSLGNVQEFGKSARETPKDSHGLRTEDLSSALANSDRIDQSRSLNPFTHLAALPYTTGTTGPSKGVMLTHFNLLASQYQFNHALSNKEGVETAIVLFPFSHIGGLNAALGTLVNSASTVVAFEKFDAKKVLAAVDMYRPTLFYGVPTAYVALMSNDGQLGSVDFSSIRCAISSGAPLPPEVKTKFAQRTGIRIMDSWGMTESSPVLTCSPMGAIKPNLIGFPVLETEVKVVDIAHQDVFMPIGEVGELVARGPQVMKGYWKSADATSQTIVNGWLHTGDLGYMDEDGSFYYIDRKKDIINVGGLKVWPSEVEGVLYECPSVSEVVVGSESDQYYGEVVTAWVVLKSGYDQLQEEKILKEYCISKLARYKVPNRINFVTEIPKSPVGKLLRRAFRQSGS